MARNQMSGYCRSTAILIIISLALCITAASAATLNNNLVVSKVTQTFEIATTTAPVYATCPSGYDCMTEADAAAQLGSYTKYSDAICGYKQNIATLAAVIRTPQYCVKKTDNTNPVTCPEGCSCMLESAAKEKFQGVYKRCSEKPCAMAVTGTAQVSAYCFGPGTTATPPGTCPEGCSCISEATANAMGGSWSRCSADICGYEQSTATVAAVVQVPKYCMKQVTTTPVCPDGCKCISDADARLNGLTLKCDENEKPCGYQNAAATANIQGNQIPLYCYKAGITAITPTPVCPDNCGGCMNEADAKAKFGPFNYTRCSEKVCGYDQTATTAYSQPRYCFKSTVTPAPLVCPEGCYCVQEAEAKAKFGPSNYTRCKAEPCGNDPSAASANGIPKYCFKPTITPIPAVCPQGCVCTTDEIAKVKGLTPCRGVLTSCGANQNNQPMHCFEQVPSPTCVYDYQKNVCTGSCQQGYTCGMLASEKDATGKITYAVCGCTGQPTEKCTYDKEKQACGGACPNGVSCTIVGKNVDEKSGETTLTCGCPPPSSEQCTFDNEKQTCAGTCQSGAACAIIGKKTDDKTGEVYTFCGCPPQPGSCSYDYSKEACAGTCAATGQNCQLNTIYRDPTTGKVTYAECHCKGSGETTPACALDANNRCSGTCPQGGQCTSITTRDDSGAEKASCSCGGPQAVTPAGVATRQPGILEAIGSFFNKLFGGK